MFSIQSQCSWFFLSVQKMLSEYVQSQPHLTISLGKQTDLIWHSKQIWGNDIRQCPKNRTRKSHVDPTTSIRWAEYINLSASNSTNTK